jgi:hypothetical protein
MSVDTTVVKPKGAFRFFTNLQLSPSSAPSS